MLIEASEESGSPDLPAHVELLADRLGSPELVVCLDSGCLDTERLWVTTSLRGLAGGNLTVEVLTEGAHSGQASGIVPSSFRLLRRAARPARGQRAPGTCPLPELHVKLPVDRVVEARRTAADLPHAAADEFHFAGATRPMVDRPGRAARRPELAADASATSASTACPPTGRAGNVLRPSTTLKLSFRLPPTCDHEAALAAIEQALLADPPNGATVRFDDAHSAPGWNAPPFAPWLAAALDEASQAAFGQPARTFGEGGTIPFMGMLGEQFPAAQFVVTGALVPGSNAHGPDEFLHLPTARRVTECIARLLGAHAASPSP